MKNTYVLFSLVVVGIISVITNLGQVPGGEKPDNGNDRELREVLRELGNQYDCYFTIEIGLIDGDHGKSLERIAPEVGRKLLAERQQTLDKKLAWLDATVPRFDYEVDRTNPSIIHVIDSRLRTIEGYVLERKLKRFSFTGTVFDLVRAVGRTGIPISPRGAVDTLELQLVDYSTEVHVVARHGLLREILSTSIPLENHSRVLWISETELGGKSTTYIRYLK